MSIYFVCLDVCLCMCLRGIFFLNQMSSFHFDKQDSSSLILLKSTFFQKQNFESWSFAQQSNYLREYHKRKFCWTMHSLLVLKRFFFSKFYFRNKNFLTILDQEIDNVIVSDIKLHIHITSHKQITFRYFPWTQKFVAVNKNIFFKFQNIIKDLKNQNRSFYPNNFTISVYIWVSVYIISFLH